MKKSKWGNGCNIGSFNGETNVCSAPLTPLLHSRQDVDIFNGLVYHKQETAERKKLLFSSFSTDSLSIYIYAYIYVSLSAPPPASLSHFHSIGETLVVKSIQNMWFPHPWSKLVQRALSAWNTLLVRSPDLIASFGVSLLCLVCCFLQPDISLLMWPYPFTSRMPFFNDHKHYLYDFHVL